MAFNKREESLPCLDANRLAGKPRISTSGSHKQLEHPEFPDEFTWAFHDSVEIGPKMLARIAKRTGLKPEDL
jgi:predicted RNA binding protein YcfA (HicA-like mRNA interferase family)